MRAIELIAWLAQALLAVALGFAGLAMLLGCALLLSPIRFDARADSLRYREDEGFDREALAVKAEMSGLFGAVRMAVDWGKDGTEARLRVFGFSPPLPVQMIRAAAERGRARKKADQDGTGDTSQSRANQSRAKSSGSWHWPGRSKAAGQAERRPQLDLGTLRRLLPELRWLAAESKRSLRLAVEGSLVYGFPDPFATGLVHGVIAAAPFPKLHLTPDFAQGRLEGWVQLRFRASPWQFSLLFARFCFRPAVRSLLWSLLRGAQRVTPKKTREVVST